MHGCSRTAHRSASYIAYTSVCYCVCKCGVCILSERRVREKDKQGGRFRERESESERGEEGRDGELGEGGGFKKSHIGENNQLINDLGYPLFNK